MKEQRLKETKFRGPKLREAKRFFSKALKRKSTMARRAYPLRHLFHLKKTMLYY
jgi:hypothetical protein